MAWITINNITVNTDYIRDAYISESSYGEKFVIVFRDGKHVSCDGDPQFLFNQFNDMVSSRELIPYNRIFNPINLFIGESEED